MSARKLPQLSIKSTRSDQAIQLIQTLAVELFSADRAGAFQKAGHAAVEAVAAVAGISRRAVSCFVAPDDSTGTRTRAAAMPVRLGLVGVAGVDAPTLSVAAQVALDNAMLL